MILLLHYKVRNLFLIEQEVGAKLNGIEWQRTPKECLMTGALPFSDQRERMPLCYAKKPMANG